MKQGKLFLIFLLLNACSVGPDYVRPTVATPSQFKEAPPGWKVATPQNCDDSAWWEVFKDQELNQLMNKLNVQNETIKGAIAQYYQACALIAQAQAAYFPTATAAVSVTPQKQSSLSSPNTNVASTSTLFVRAPYTDHNVTLEATWAPDLWGSVRRSVEASVAGAQASKDEIAAVRLLSQASLAQYYFQLRGLDNNQSVLDKTVKTYKKILEITLNQYKVGTASRAQILQIQSLLEQAEVLALDNGILRAQYEHAIAVLMGEPPANFSVVPRSYTATMPIIPTQLPSSLLERRPDIAQAERLVAQANAEIGVAISAYFPVLTLTGMDGWDSINLAKWFTAPAHFWSLGSQLLETVFDGGLRGAKVAQARAVYDQTVAQYRQTVLSAFQNVEDNLAGWRILEKEHSKQNEAVKTAQHSLKIVINEYNAGTAQLSDILNSEITLYGVEQNAYTIAYRQSVAVVSLIQALGGGWKND